MSRFGALNEIYNDYLNSSTNVQVIGVGKNNGTPVNNITSSNNLPWVKENSTCDVWSTWEASNRDLYIMDRNGEIAQKISLLNSIDETYIKYIIEGL